MANGTGDGAPSGKESGVGGKGLVSLEVRGTKVAIVAATGFVNLRCRGSLCPIMFDGAAGEDALVATVATAATEHDIVVVMLHWMNEDRIKPNKAERAFAKRLADAGATVIVGGHSHVLGPAEMLARESESRAKDHPAGGTTTATESRIAGTDAATGGNPTAGDGATAGGDPAARSNAYVRYSLGNFVHAMKRFPTKLGGIDTVCLVRKEGLWSVESATLTPTWARRNAGAAWPKAFQALPLQKAMDACGKAPPELVGAECDEVREYHRFLGAHPEFHLGAHPGILP